MTTRRKFLINAAAGAAIAPLASRVMAQSSSEPTIKWRMQTYAGAALAEHVAKPAIDLFNRIAGDRMQIELYYADQLVPTGELFRAMQRGTIDAVQSDDDSMASPPRSPSSVATSPSGHGTASMCRCSSTSTG